jgi:hypothetical protein
MGDLFHQTNANQTATNQQVGISTRDVGGNFTTGGANAVTASSGVAGGAGSVTGGQLAVNNSTVTVSSLDPLALQTTAQAVHDALVSNVAAGQAAAEGYQKALTVLSENAQASQAATAQAGSVAGILGLNPSQIIWLAALVVGGVLVAGYFRKH